LELTKYLKWGSIFENVTQMWAVWLYKLPKFYTVGGVTNPKYPYMRYSPDGFGIVENMIILFEFKAPFIKNYDICEIPANYIPQVKAGLDVCEVCDGAIYIANIYRKCLFNDLNFSVKHISHGKDLELGEVECLAFSVIIFYTKTKRTQ
jgi:hypothetical protein